jgi:DNA-binding SARP family transcriptional activator
LIGAHLEAAEVDAAIDVAHRVLKIEPYSEEAYCALIEAHAQLGHLSQVDRWYELMTTVLKAGLGVEPSDATIELYERAMRSELRTISH